MTERQEGTFCETILWNARDKLDPPRNGYIMFASSDPDTNVSHLLEEGYHPEDIVIVEYDGGRHETIWIPLPDSDLQANERQCHFQLTRRCICSNRCIFQVRTKG